MICSLTGYFLFLTTSKTMISRITAAQKPPSRIVLRGNCVTKMAVGPSAPPMMPIEEALFIAKSSLKLIAFALSVFEEAVRKLRSANITVIVHTILGLPGETEKMILDTVNYLNTQDIQGVKFQLLHILKNTDLADYYEEHPFWIPTMDEYFSLLSKCISFLSKDIVIHRLTGDGPKSLLIAPLWSANKRQVLNQMQAYFKNHDIWQGKEL